MSRTEAIGAARAALCANPLCLAVLGTGKDDRNRGLCRPCYKRWRRKGFAGDGPGAPLSRSEAAQRINARRSAERQARLEDYAWCRMQRETNEMAALRVGVSPEWAYATYRPAVLHLIAAGGVPEVTADAA